MPGRSLMDLRAANRRAVTTALADGLADTRAGLARVTGLSPATVSSIVSELLAAGVVRTDEEPPRHRGGSGRPAVRLVLTVRPGHVAAVDVGHRHLRVAVADRAGQIVAEAVEPADSGASGRTTLERAARALEPLAREAGTTLDALVGATLCLPGPVDLASSAVGREVLPSWADLAPADHLARRLGVPVHVDNDANLGAVGEHRHGAGSGASDVVYVKVSGGLGAGLVLAGRLHRGSSGIAGELGHVRVVDGGLACRCGSRGCLETEVSVGRLLELLRPAYGEVDLPAVLALEEQGDPGVRQVLGDAGRTVGRALGALCTVLNPEVVVVGGALGASGALVAGIREGIDRSARPDAAAAVDVRPGQLGDRAEIVGAVTIAVAIAAARPLAD